MNKRPDQGDRRSHAGRNPENIIMVAAEGRWREMIRQLESWQDNAKTGEKLPAATAMHGRLRKQMLPLR